MVFAAMTVRRNPAHCHADLERRFADLVVAGIDDLDVGPQSIVPGQRIVVVGSCTSNDLVHTGGCPPQSHCNYPFGLDDQSRRYCVLTQTSWRPLT